MSSTSKQALGSGQQIAYTLINRHADDGVDAARVVPTMSPEALAEMVGATPSRVAGLLQKFRKLGFIGTNDGRSCAINPSLLSVVLQD